jgi:hypothetical protein
VALPTAAVPIAPVPERTARRWRSRLAATAMGLLEALGAAAPRVPGPASCREVVIAWAAAHAVPPGRRLASLAAALHALAPGVRVM